MKSQQKRARKLKFLLMVYKAIQYGKRDESLYGSSDYFAFNSSRVKHWSEWQKILDKEKKKKDNSVNEVKNVSN